jgi:hypothetical protein
MSPLQRFGTYAADFERTYKDDDWSRLDEYFTPDATYEVAGEKPFGCVIRGRDAIFKGIKRALDGFDRRFAKREVALDGAPSEEGDTCSLAWAVTYERPGAPPFVLRGRSTATYAGDRISRLVDSYDAAVIRDAVLWLQKHAPDLDPSYV